MKRLILILALAFVVGCGCEKKVKMEGPCERCGRYTRYLSVNNELCPDCVIPAAREKRNKIDWRFWIAIGAITLGGLAKIAGGKNSDDD